MHMFTPFTTGDRLSWFDPSGMEWPFNGEQWAVFSNGVIGLRGIPPSTTTTGKVPQSHGEIPRYTLFDPRPFEIPILMKGISIDDFTAGVDAYRSAFDPTAGAKGQGTSGYWRVTNNANRQRVIYARYTGGFPYDETNVFAQLEATLQFTAYDPFFYDADYVSVVTASAGGGVPFFPMLPINLSPDGVIGSFSTINDGDAEAYPLITIQGAGDDPVLTNNTTGKSMDFTGVSLADGDTLVVDTQAKTVRLNGALSFSSLVSGSSLWTLAKGNNNISLAMTSTDSSSLITVQYRRRWLGA